MKGSTPAERFWTFMDRSGGPDACWEWQKCRIHGYGVAWDGTGKHPRAHRYAWILTHGAIPEGIDVLHHCDNPPCCNPKHLWLGTDLDNRRDCLRKGRGNFAKGEKNANAKITAADVRQIRELVASGKYSQQEIAAHFGINQQNVSNIASRKAWSHV